MLQKGDATLARVAVYKVTSVRRRKKQSLVAYCELDLASRFEVPEDGKDASDSQGAKSAPIVQWHDLQVQYLGQCTGSSQI